MENSCLDSRGTTKGIELFWLKSYNPINIFYALIVIPAGDLNIVSDKNMEISEQ